MRRSRHLFLFFGLLGGALTACAPAAQPARQATARPGPDAPTAEVQQAGSFRAAFAPEGVAWVSAGVACVARAPAYRTTCPRLPPVVDVAWNGGDAWAAVPNLGLIVTLDRAARSVSVGRVVALTRQRVYREDGSALNYAAGPERGVLGGPSAVITGGDGEDYAVVGGRLRRVSSGGVLQGGVGEPFLMPTPQGAQPSPVPAITTFAGTYRLTGGQLQRLDSTGRVIASVPHGPGRVGLVGQDLVTVSPAGEIRVFGVDLQAR